MRVVAIIQARMGSTRLPGKVLMPLGKSTVLGQVITRVRACRLVSLVVVATTGRPIDDPIVVEAERHGAVVVRGSEGDVLARYHLAATEVNADIVVRITADCPLIDPDLIEAMLTRFIQQQSTAPPTDYLSNTLTRTFPRGLDVEIFRFHTLARTHREAQREDEREHVTPYIYRHPEMFMLENFRQPVDLSSNRWTLDTSEDYELINRIYESLSDRSTHITTNEVLQLIARNPEWRLINAYVEQKGIV